MKAVRVLALSLLAVVALAELLSRRETGGGECRKDHRDEHRDDGDHHEQLDERERSLVLDASHGSLSERREIAQTNLGVSLR